MRAPSPWSRFWPIAFEKFAVLRGFVLVLRKPDTVNADVSSLKPLAFFPARLLVYQATLWAQQTAATSATAGGEERHCANGGQDRDIIWDELCLFLSSCSDIDPSDRFGCAAFALRLKPMKRERASELGTTSPAWTPQNKAQQPRSCHLSTC